MSTNSQQAIVLLVTSTGEDPLPQILVTACNVDCNSVNTCDRRSDQNTTDVDLLACESNATKLGCVSECITRLVVRLIGWASRDRMESDISV